MTGNVDDISKEIKEEIKAVDCGQEKVFCELHQSLHKTYNAFCSHKYGLSKKHPIGEKTTLYRGNNRIIARTSLPSEEIIKIQKGQEKSTVVANNEERHQTNSSSTTTATTTKNLSSEVAKDSFYKTETVESYIDAVFRYLISECCSNGDEKEKRVERLASNQELVSELKAFCGLKILTQFVKDEEKLGNVDNASIEYFSDGINEIDKVLSAFESDPLLSLSIGTDVAFLKSFKEEYAKKIGYLYAKDAFAAKRKRSQISAVVEKSTIVSSSSDQERQFSDTRKRLKLANDEKKPVKSFCDGLSKDGIESDNEEPSEEEEDDDDYNN